MQTKRSETLKVGKKGSFVLPSSLRKEYGFEEGTLVIAERRKEGVMLRPAVVTPIEIYTDERIAEFLLGNAVGMDEYMAARNEVKEMGFDPDKIPHFKPA